MRLYQTLNKNKNHCHLQHWPQLFLTHYQMNSSFDHVNSTMDKTNTNAIKSNLIRNLSLRSKGTTSQASQPKQSKKSQQKTKKNENSYIARALANIQKGCIDQKTGFLRIDGDLGDYKMKIFRYKDKLKHYNNSSSLFNDKQFLQHIWDYADCGVKKLQQSKQLIPALEEPQSPKKGFKQERARLGLKKQNSIVSPGIKQIQPEKLETINEYQKKQKNELIKDINQILSKSREAYLPQLIANPEEEEKDKLKRGIQQQLREKEGHLFYRSIPQYMAEKWFKTVDNSTPDGNYVTPYIEQKPIVKPTKRLRHKRTHLFRFLQKNCGFDVSKSMIDYKSHI